MILSMDWITPFDWTLPDRTISGVRTGEEYLTKLRSLVKTKTKADGMIITWGYHHYFHDSISKSQLDNICPDLPLIVWHRSFHELYLNSYALDMTEFEDLESLKQHSQVDWDNGHFYEGGMEELLSKSTLFLTMMERLESGYLSAVRAIHAGGITTIADLEFPMLDESTEFEFANRILKSSIAEFATYCVPSSRYYLKMKGSHAEAMEEIHNKSSKISSDKMIMFTDHVKIIGDGAFFSQLMQMKDGYTDGHTGQWFTSPEVTYDTMVQYWRQGYQIHVHTNGDLAMQMLLDNVETLMKEFPRPDHRTTVEHAGFFTPDQAARIKKLGCLVSAQPYYHAILADKYSEVGLGEERAKSMCPIGLLEDQDIKFALHSDFTMAPAQPLLLAWCAVNRVTLTSGQCNNPHLCVTPMAALRGNICLVSNNLTKRKYNHAAIEIIINLFPNYFLNAGITLSAAEILGISDKVGSLETGKDANLVILEQNPLKVDKLKIKDIKIVSRIFRGKEGKIN